MTVPRLFLALLACFLAPAAAWPAVETTWYVAPGGSDANPGTEAQPFATLERARQAVRTVNGNMQSDVVVMLAGGTYRLDRPLGFWSGGFRHGWAQRDLSSPSGQTPVLSGGKPVTGWQPDEKGRWKAPAPVENFRQLYVNGARAIRARGVPPAAMKRVDNTGYTTTAVEMANWRN